MFYVAKKKTAKKCHAHLSFETSEMAYSWSNTKISTELLGLGSMKIGR